MNAFEVQSKGLIMNHLIIFSQEESKISMTFISTSQMWKLDGERSSDLAKDTVTKSKVQPRST